MCQARKKWVVSAVPIGKSVVTFMLHQKGNTHKSHKWFAGHYSLVAGTAGSSNYFE
jgi:hypothetical protein